MKSTDTKASLFQRVLLLALACCAALSLHAARPKAVIGVRLNTQPVIFSEPRPGIDAPQLLFTEERGRATVELMMNPLRLSNHDVSRGERILLPSPEWWSLLQWTIRTQDAGGLVSLPGEIKLLNHSVRRDGAATGRVPALHDDEVLVADLELPPIAPGEYVLNVSLSLPPVEKQPAITLRSDDVAFSVRNGEEDVDTRRAYLRRAAERIVSTPAPDWFERFRDTMLTLAALEPNNPGLFERLGDVAINVRPAEETLAYYETAVRLSEENLTKKYGSLDKLPPDVQAYWTKRKDALTAFARFYPVYGAAGENTHLLVQNIDGKKRITIYRGGKPTKTID